MAAARRGGGDAALIGDRRIAAELGLTPAEAAALLARARRRHGLGSHLVRRLAFLAAASAPGRRLPPNVRGRALGALLGQLLVTSGDALGYVGVGALDGREQARGLRPGAP